MVLKSTAFVKSNFFLVDCPNLQPRIYRAREVELMVDSMIERKPKLMKQKLRLLDGKNKPVKPPTRPSKYRLLFEDQKEIFAFVLFLWMKTCDFLVLVEDRTAMVTQAFTEGIGKHGKKPPKPPASYKKMWYGPASDLGLPDKYTFTAVSDYLALNGKYSMKSVSIFRYTFGLSSTRLTSI